MSERLEILGLIESGQITVEEGLRRIKALDGAHGAGETAAEPAQRPSVGSAESATAPARPRYAGILWQVVFNIGVACLAGGGALLATAYRKDGGPGAAWGWVVLGLGLLGMILGWWLKEVRWFSLRVHEHRGRRLNIALPLPLGLVLWMFRIVGPFVPQLRGTSADELILAMQEQFRQGRSFAIQVDEGSNGDRVEIHFG